MSRLASLIVSLCAMLVVPVAAQDPGSDTEQFDRRVFGVINSPENPFAALEAQVDLELARIAQSINLSNDQIERLRLAGRGDIQRFYVRVEHARRQLLAMNNSQKGNNNNNNINRLAMPLKIELKKGLFGTGSLFQKVVANSLDDRQSAALQQHLSRVNKLQTESAVRMFVSKIGLHLPLTSGQRTKLTDVLLENVKSVGNNSTYRFHVVLYRFGKVPREEYETFFDKDQMQMIANLTRAGQEIGEYLKEEGVIDDE